MSRMHLRSKGHAGTRIARALHVSAGQTIRHPGAGRDPGVSQCLASAWIPACAGMTGFPLRSAWIPARAGMTGFPLTSAWVPTRAGMTGFPLTSIWTPACAGTTRGGHAA
jgi:hypothetical protein